MEYTASTAVPKTYTEHQVNVSFDNGVLLGWCLGIAFMVFVMALISFFSDF